MDNLDKKIIENFPGKFVRKDLVSIMKRSANVPSYVLEYLFGMYCATDDEQLLEKGIRKIHKILAENYVHSEETEVVKSKMREQGKYTIIDKISVSLNEYTDKYMASFTNFKIDELEIPEQYVFENQKLLMGGMWCILTLAYDHSPYTDSPFQIQSLKSIQMPKFSLEEMKEVRKNFTKEEWEFMLLRSEGYEPMNLSDKERLHFLLRLAPLVQKNYNLVELGPRGTGKSHIYQEISPYALLMSGGKTTVANMFYNMRTGDAGLVAHWDCVAFDEVAGMDLQSTEAIQIMKNYMANGSFARGKNTIVADASLCFVGNTNDTVQNMLRYTNLFSPFPEKFNRDSAFFDRIHYYLPGWEIPKLCNEHLTENYGLITDCLSEYCHEMRKYDYAYLLDKYFSFNGAFNKRDDIAVRNTFSALAKLLYPNEQMEKTEAQQLLNYAIEGRRRVKEQLKKMAKEEFAAVELGYIDNETGEQFIVDLPENVNK